ncbi:MAG TPA: hemolysin III family protein [Oscillospiraceae bacterium]|nr:hemolysin III family protein [Oscillospiraceae bacterium]
MESSMPKCQATDKNKWRAERRNQLNLPSYSVSEEVMNAISHGIGALFAVAALVVLLLVTPHHAKNIVSVSIYGGTLFLLYTVSTLYHALGVTKAKKVFQILDHCTIFLLIAGTYTPITILCLGGTLGWVMFFLVWVAAIVGITLNAVNMKRFRVVSMVCYICMGWAVLFAIKPLVQNLDFTAVVLLIVGGVFYTVGAIIYGKGRTVKYMHSLWHIFVLAGSIMHFIVIYHIAIK